MIIVKIMFAIGFILMITLNILANALPFNGKTTGQVSDQYDNLFTPSGMTFSIWGVIYVLLSLVLVYLLFKPNTYFEQQVNLKIIILLTALSFFNGLWIVL